VHTKNIGEKNLQLEKIKKAKILSKNPNVIDNGKVILTKKK
jgi:hypothetical protein